MLNGASACYHRIVPALSAQAVGKGPLTRRGGQATIGVNGR